ncbi:MAG: alkaline phosphatase family protein [Vicinamibacteria bacterium]|nr:alkaline phosphatase family protein [Vicinamibacteria bacterium]
MKTARLITPALLAGGAFLCAAPAEAYIGPGAGFALLSSFLVLFTTMVIAAFSVLLWPLRTLVRILRRRRRPEPWIKRLIIVGFDGQDFGLTNRWLAEGKLPNFQKLAGMGCYHSLKTSHPSISPVAWSSFSTGAHPAKHRIFDFLDRDRRTYLPQLSSTRVGKVDRFLSLGRWRIPLRKPELRLLRGSKPFWTLLGERNVWSTVLRVPITFPPERFYGAQLSAMCAPDLLGTQGTFLLFTTRPAGERFKEGGLRIPLSRNGNGFTATLEGPNNLFIKGEPPMRLPLSIRIDGARKRARIAIGDVETDLEPRRLSDWIQLSFRAAPLVTVSAITRLMITEMDEHVSLYMSPLNIDPEKPAMPISHPSYYATYLAKRIGPYATLGLAEDTWALNEGVIDDATFLRMTYDIDLERQAMFRAALERMRAGTLTCVFDATDRIQHMFWRYLEDGHPAGTNRENAAHADAIEALYRHNDAFVGELIGGLDKGDVLIVLSDHGFSSFRRGVNLNAWLLANGYLALQEGKDGSAEWLREVDWSRTQAYALGLAGLYLNVKGREASGVVAPGEEARRVKTELIEKLSGLVDEEKGAVGVREVFDTAALYQGPYLDNAPDLLVGFNAGYRTSWDCATGMASGPVFEDNLKAWSGDHTIDPRLVPGVIFCNVPIDREDPALIDLAPTALKLFGIQPPPHMDGKTLFEKNPLARRDAGGKRTS